MGLDIRLPIGLLFSLLGALLIIAGLIMDKGIYQRRLRRQAGTALLIAKESK